MGFFSLPVGKEVGEAEEEDGQEAQVQGGGKACRTSTRSWAAATQRYTEHLPLPGQQ